MSKDARFYERYLVAVFRRGKAAVLPKEYIDGQARKVLSGQELEEMNATLARFVDAGVVTKGEQGYSLDATRAREVLDTLKS